MRSILQIRNSLIRQPNHTITIRLLNTSITRLYSKFNEKYQGPPKLPRKDQEEFERLQNIAMSQIAIEDYNDRLAQEQQNMQDITDNKPPVVQENSDIGSFAYLKTIPEFEGDVNPKTGERGGPKQDPLKRSDEWTFNGRTIDF
ncbi:hypothetical protein KGF54_004374 [Candida jiufengensis]|uniref:uncharacterized protein n=1 Tax=Candida jiufengensis TaxID=497108 RepID=UPI002224CE13|nr:uncharacterized protein KGF54_004374 [Candida jiufengensis]KAI5951300.1 hypothetical protein KGF54_004374 [Candida jiufengensis]